MQHNSKTGTSLSPLHYKLIANFPLVCFQVEHEIGNLKIQQTKEEIHVALEVILKNKGVIPESLQAYASRVQKVINEKIYKKNNFIFYHELPEGWEDFFRRSIDTITLNSIKRDEYKAIYEEVVLQIKQNNKISFSEIYEKLKLSKTGLGNGVAKINTELENKFGIEFIKIGNAGNILLIKKVKRNKISSVPVENFIKACESIDKINSEHLNIINKAFRDFYLSISMKTNHFKVVDFIKFAQDNGVELTSEAIRGAFGNYKKNLERLGITIETSQNYNTIHFHQEIFDSYFIEKSQGTQFKNELLKKIKHHDREFVKYFSDALLEESFNHTFFTKETFLESSSKNFPYGISTLNEFCGILLKKGILMKGGKSLYYLNKDYFNNTNSGIHQ